MNNKAKYFFKKVLFLANLKVERTKYQCIWKFLIKKSNCSDYAWRINAYTVKYRYAMAIRLQNQLKISALIIDQQFSMTLLK